MPTPLTHLVKGDGAALPGNRSGREFALKYTLDCGAVPIESGEIVKLTNVPASVVVKDVIVNVRTPEGATLTLDIGDYLIATDVAVNADGFIDGVNGNSAAVTKTSDQLAEDTTTLNYAAGKVYTAATAYIGVLFNNAAATAVIDVHVVCTNLDG